MTAHRTVARTAAAFAAALILALATGAAEPTGTPLGNADIVSMTRANVSPTLIINRIQTSPNNFDLSDQAFMELKASGVADVVLNAMLAASRGGAAAAGIPALQLPALPGGSGAQTLMPTALPPLGGGDNWADLGQDLANLPPPPALPAFSAPPGAGTGSGSGASALSQLPALAAPPAPIPAPAAPAADPFVYAPVPAAPAAQAFSAPPAAQAPVAPSAVFSAPAAPAVSGLEAGRFERELGNVVNGTPEARRAALAWMLANRQQTLPGLRQALGAASRPEMQAGAVQALGALHDQDSLPTLRDLLGSPSPLVRREAAKALAQMNDAPAIAAAEQNLGNNVDPLDGLIHLVGYARLVRASDRLGTILSGNPSALNRAAAAAALAEIGRGGAAAWPALERALAGDADASVRREAARAVAQFHDPGSAALLMSACRRDPEVRKVTLEAMAQYPETVEFLVGVVGLGADQIAPDESEAARASLAALTGQNFGLDGARWSAWFAENGSRFGAGGSASAVAAGGIPGIPGMPEGSPASSPVSGGMTGQVDITALGMIVDPSQIPMAPELAEGPGFGGGASAGAPGLLRVPGAGSGFDGSAAPGALSANDFGMAGDAGLLGGGAGAGVAPSAEGDMRARRLPTPAGFEEYGDEQMWGGSMPSSTMSVLPQQPVVQPTPSAPADTGASSGLRLALPPMAGVDAAPEYGTPPAEYGSSAEYGSPAEYSAPPADFAQTQPYNASGADAAAPYGEPWGEYADPSAGYAPAGGSADPFAEPYSDPYASGGSPSSGGYDDPDAMPLPPEYYAIEAERQRSAASDSYDDDGGDDGGFALPPPPGDGQDTLAFPGDTDDFGIGDPMFEEGSADWYDDASYADGGAGTSLPPPPGGEAGDGEQAEASGADAFEDYGYGEYNDGLSDSDSDFGDDDFAAFLQEADATASGTEEAEALSEDPAGPPAEAAPEGTADWVPEISEPYTLDPVADPDEEPAVETAPADGGGSTMEWVRGVGLVEREAVKPAPAPAPAAAPAIEPELIVPESMAPPAPAVETDRDDAGAWHYVEPPAAGDSSPSGAAVNSAPNLPIIAEDVYEVPEAVEMIPSDPSGRPSRRLRMQR